MRFRNSVALLALLVIVITVGWQLYQKLQLTNQEAPEKRREVLGVPVLVEDIKKGNIEEVRVFTGTLDAHQKFVIAPKVGGRIKEINVDLADPVSRNQVVARLDNAEYQQAVNQAEADVTVARANLGEADSLLKIAAREKERVEKLRKRGVSTEADQDAAVANFLTRGAHLEVTRAQLSRAKSTLESARIRLGYTQVTASWRGGNDTRVVAEKYVDEGETVNANAPLIKIVELDQVIALVHVTERDYGLLHPEQRVEISTDAYPGETFIGYVARISPVFLENVRQARVELRIDNPSLKLKPGMFVRASILLKRIEDATIIPEKALAIRDGDTGLFLVNPDGETVSWYPVQTGIRQGHDVEVLVDGILHGQVVTLGQQLIQDGSKVLIDTGSAL